MGLKDLARKSLRTLKLDLSKNLEYDRLTAQIMKKNIRNDSNCIDVGCHRGEILEEMIQLAPDGKFFAFEPLPDFYHDLKSRFGGKAEIFPYALSDEEGKTSFQFVRNAPAFSGIRKRSYLVNQPDIVEIEVEMRRLDDVIPESTRINFIKIDVEGGELAVIKGATHLLSRDKPMVIFECGLGASDHYHVTPDMVSETFNQLGYSLYTLRDFVQDKAPLNAAYFNELYQSNKEYYFVAKA